MGAEKPEDLPVNCYVFHTSLPYTFNPAHRIPTITALYEPSKQNDPDQLQKILDRHDRLEEVIEHIAANDTRGEPQPVTLAVAAARQRDAEEYGMKNGLLMLVTLLAVQPRTEPYPVKMCVRETGNEWEMKPGDVIGVRYHLHWSITLDPTSSSSSPTTSHPSPPAQTKASALVMISVWDLTYRGLVVDVSGFDKSRLTIESGTGSPLIPSRPTSPDVLGGRRRLRSRSRSRTVSVSMTGSDLLPPSRAKTPENLERSASRMRRTPISRPSSRAGHVSGSSLSDVEESTLASASARPPASRRPTSPDISPLPSRPGSRARTRSTRVSISMSEYIPDLLGSSGRAKSPDGKPRPRTRRTVSMVVSDVEKTTSDSRSHSSQSDEVDQSRAPSPSIMRTSSSPRGGSAFSTRPRANRARTMTGASAGSDHSIEPLRYVPERHADRVHFPEAETPPRHSRRATSPGPSPGRARDARPRSRSRSRSRVRVSMLADEMEGGMRMSLGAAGEQF